MDDKTKAQLVSDVEALKDDEEVKLKMQKRIYELRRAWAEGSITSEQQEEAILLYYLSHLPYN